MTIHGDKKHVNRCDACNAELNDKNKIGKHKIDTSIQSGYPQRGMKFKILAFCLMKPDCKSKTEGKK